MSTSAVLAELRRGPATTGQLCEATGLSRNAVGCAVRRARRSGERIVNVRGHGDRRGALYALLPNPRPVCAHEGCGTRLSASNATPYCRRHASAGAVDTLIAWLEQDIRDGAQIELLEVAG